jgi:hypothetical protein
MGVLAFGDWISEIRYQISGNKKREKRAQKAKHVAMTGVEAGSKPAPLKPKGAAPAQKALAIVMALA